jgi:hypothetical protein
MWEKSLRCTRDYTECKVVIFNNQTNGFFTKHSNAFPLKAKPAQTTKEMHKRNLLDFIFAKTRTQIGTTHW